METTLIILLAAAAGLALTLTLRGRRKAGATAARLASLQTRHEALVNRVDANTRKYEAVNARYNAVNAEIGGLRKCCRVTFKGLEAVEGLLEQARRAARKKVRTKDPRTGRFVWRYPEELE